MLTERDEDILWHVGLYRLTLRPVLAEAFGLATPGNVLSRLRRAKLLRERTGLPGGVSYYQLTEASAAGRVPLDRTNDLGHALPLHLAVLWWCHFAKHPKRRLEVHELEELFGDNVRFPPQIPHCVDRNVPGAKRRRVWRVYVPGPSTTPSKVVRAIRQDIAHAEEAGGKLEHWLKETRTYAFAVLVDSEPRRRQLRQILGPLHEEVSIAVDVAPSPERLGDFLRGKNTTLLRSADGQ